MKEILLMSLLFLFTISPKIANAQENYSLDIPQDGYVDIGNVLNFNYNDQLSIAYWFKVDSEEEMRISNRAACDSGAGSDGCHRGYEFLVGSW